MYVFVAIAQLKKNDPETDCTVCVCAIIRWLKESSLPEE